MKIKTIDINAKEWFDKVNGNSYHAGKVTVNFGMKNEKSFNFPFQYGYGDQYRHTAFQTLEENNVIKLVHNDNGSTESHCGYCERNNIILRSNIIRGCKKRDLKEY